MYRFTGDFNGTTLLTSAITFFNGGIQLLSLSIMYLHVVSLLVLLYLLVVSIYLF